MASTFDQRGSSAGFAGAISRGRHRKGGEAPLRERNRRVAMLLVGWIIAMAIISVLVIVLR
jgi:hypothetical protein